MLLLARSISIVVPTGKGEKAWSLAPPLSRLFLPAVQQLVNPWLLMWPMNNTLVYFPQQQSNGGFIHASVINGEADESARMHVLHGPPGSHHLHERQDDDDFVGGGTGGMAVKFGAFVKGYYERMVESASENKK